MYIIIQTHLCVINCFQQCCSMILLKLFLFKTHWMCLFTWSISAGTRRNNNVIITSRQHHDIVLISWWRHYCVMCPLGLNLFLWISIAPDEPSLPRIICSRLCSWLSFCVWYHGLTTSILCVGSFWSLKQMASEFDIKELNSCFGNFIYNIFIYNY